MNKKKIPFLVCGALILLHGQSHAQYTSIVQDSVVYVSLKGKQGQMAALVYLGHNNSLTIPSTINDPEGNPYSVVQIGGISSDGHYNTESITIETGDTILDNSFEAREHHGHIPFAFYTNTLETIIIPNSVIDIGSYSLGGCSFTGDVCSNLKCVVIGESVEKIGYAFTRCDKLVKIQVLAEYPPSVKKGTFNDVPPYADIIVPCGTKYRYVAADDWKDFPNITEDCSDIEDTDFTNFGVKVSNGRIVVSGAEGQPIHLYDLKGRSLNIDTRLHKGIYLVQVGSLPARKVVVM